MNSDKSSFKPFVALSLGLFIPPNIIGIIYLSFLSFSLYSMRLLPFLSRLIITKLRRHPILTWPNIILFDCLQRRTFTRAKLPDWWTFHFSKKVLSIIIDYVFCLIISWARILLPYWCLVKKLFKGGYLNRDF